MAHAPSPCAQLASAVKERKTTHLEKGGIGLKRGGDVARLGDDAQAKGLGGGGRRPARAVAAVGQVRRARVEAHAQQAVDGANARFQLREERSVDRHSRTGAECRWGETRAGKLRAR